MTVEFWQPKESRFRSVIWNGENIHEIKNLIQPAQCADWDEGSIWVETTQGRGIANIGDYILLGDLPRTLQIISTQELERDYIRLESTHLTI